MMDLLGAGNPYMAQRFAEGGEAQTYQLAQSQWVPGRYKESEVADRPELGMTLSELQARDPFYSSPDYLALRRQLSDVLVNTQRERDLYAQAVDPLEERWRQLEGSSFSGELPQERRAAIERDLFSKFLEQNKDELARTKGLADFYGDVSQRLSGFLETARPGDMVAIPRNPYVGSSEQLYGGFVLENPNNPYTYEQRKKFADRGLSVVDKGFVQNFLGSEIAPKQQYWGEYVTRLSSPEFFAQQQGDQLKSLFAQESESYRIAEQQRAREEQERIRREQEALRNRVIPLVDKAQQEEEKLFWQIQNLRKQMSYPARVSTPPLVESVPEQVSSSAPTPTVSTPPPMPVPTPVLPIYSTPSPVEQPQVPISNLTPQPVPVSNLTPQPVPGVSTTPGISRGIPQPGIGSLPVYQTPTAQAQRPTSQQQQPQTQIQYGPIGQGAVGQTSLLNTLLANQQDPTKVSLLGFDNPYLMKPFG